MRSSIWAALVVCTAAAASANTGHHSSGGGGSSTAECIRWEPISVDMAGADMAGADMAHADMAHADMSNGEMSNLDLGDAPRDLGPAPRDLGDPHAGMRCVERASLFHCSFAPSGGGASGPLAVALFAVMMLARARRARRHG